MEYQPELGTVLDVADDANSGKGASLCSPRVLRFGLGMRHHLEGPFFGLSFLSSSTVLFGAFPFVLTHWESLLRRKHLLRAVGWEAASILLRLATCIREGYGVRVGGPGRP